MIKQDLVIFIFKLIWGVLLIIAVLAQFRFKGKIIERGGIIANILVVMPYLVVFGLLFLRLRS
jgi:hypothetical protein